MVVTGGGKMIKVRRLIAVYIDFVIAFIIIYLPMLIIDYIINNIIIEIIATIISLLIFLYLMIYKDLLFKNASIGKKIMGLRIYYNNKIPDKDIIIKRNKTTSLVFPLYVFQILFKNKSYGDIKCDTEVK